MKETYLGLETLARQFYLGAHNHIISTRNIFELTGVAAARRIVSDVFPELPSGQDPNGVLAIGVARAGCALATRGTVDQIGSSLTLRTAKKIPVWLAAVGASRPKEADKEPATIYFSTLGQFLQRDWSKWIVIVFEQGLATGSTAEAIFPHLRESLPGVKDENVIFFANCACVDQARERLNRVSQDAVLAFGSRWRYKEEEPQVFYLDRMWLPDEKRWWETEPRDWGGCCFHNSPQDFLVFLERQIEIGPEIRNKIQKHFASERD